MMRLSFHFDPNMCTGCDACRLACTIENGLDLGTSWRQVWPFNARRHPAAPAFHLSLGCNHCAEPACARACPALAFHVDVATGAVLLDATRCIGCRYCIWACPYDAPHFDAARGVVTKCTFCIERLRAGREPACATCCPTGALRADPRAEAAVAQETEGLPAATLRPALCVVPLRPERAAARAVAEMPPPIPAEITLPPARVGLRAEWSLVAFTTLAAVLVAVVTAVWWAPQTTFPGGLAGAAGAPLFAATALLALALGGAHLGRKRNAWRAFLGVRHSWLSREIVAFVAFAIVGAVFFAKAASPAAAPGLLAVALGFVMLACVDRVYHGCTQLPRQARPHSAGAFLTGIYLAGVFAAQPLLALGSGGVVLGLYLRRHWRARDSGRAHALVVIRVVAGFLVPAAAWLFAGPAGRPLAMLAAVAGATVDRCEYYAALEFTSPQRSLVEALAARLGAAPRRGRVFEGSIGQ